MFRRVFPILLGLLVAAATGCDDDEDGGTTGPQEEVFTATLTGAAEEPPVQTNATGLATFIVEGSIVLYTIEVANIVEATAAHIHSGPAGVNGAVLVPLFEAGGSPFTGTGTLATGSFDAADVVGDSVSFEQLVNRLGDSSLYTNVHTVANPPGEIRGQIDG